MTNLYELDDRAKGIRLPERQRHFIL